MRFVTGLVENIEAVLIRELEIAVDRRIVRSTHSIEIELLEYLHVTPYRRLVHLVPGLGMLHVGIDGLYLYGLAVQQENTILDLSLLETDLLCHPVDYLSGTIRERQRQVIEIWGLGRPFSGGRHAAFKPCRPPAAGAQRPGTGLHPGNHTPLPGDFGAHGEGIQTCVVCPHVHVYGQVRVRKGIVEISDDIPVIYPGLTGGIDPHIVEYAGKAPIILSLKIVAVRILGHEDGNGILPWPYILGDVVLRRLLPSFVVSDLTAVHPHEGS